MTPMPNTGAANRTLRIRDEPSLRAGYICSVPDVPEMAEVKEDLEAEAIRLEAHIYEASDRNIRGESHG